MPSLRRRIRDTGEVTEHTAPQVAAQGTETARTARTATKTDAEIDAERRANVESARIMHEALRDASSTHRPPKHHLPSAKG